MSRSNPPLSPMPDELREHLDGLVQNYMAARVKEDRLKKRMSAMTARLRIALAEIMDKYYERFTHVETRRKKIIAEIDKPGAARVIEIVRLQYASAEELARQIMTALRGAEESGRLAILIGICYRRESSRYD